MGLWKKLCQEKPEEPIEGICISGNGPTLATTAGEVFLWNHPVAPAILGIISITVTFVPTLAK